MSNLKAKTAAFGERMIEVKLRFWTDSLAPKRGEVIPKHAWSAGVVRMERNRPHGIIPLEPKPFNSLLEIGAVIEKVLLSHDVVLHPSSRMQRYFADAPKKRKRKAA